MFCMYKMSYYFLLGRVARWRWVAPIFRESLMEPSLEKTLVFSAPPAPRRHPQRHPFYSFLVFTQNELHSFRARFDNQRHPLHHQ